MTNREKLNKTNLFDLLVKINDEIYQNDAACAIAAVTGVEQNCRSSRCEDCISKWLNEEA